MSRYGLISIAWFSALLSSIFIFFSSAVDSLLGFWVFLELAGLAILPSFFIMPVVSLSGSYDGLLLYIVVSGLSSVFLVSGIVVSELYYFVLVGFLIKLGIFPFMVWVYRVYANSNWIFIFLLSVVMKFPVLYFGYLFGGSLSLYIVLDCCITIFVCSVVFWCFSQSWEFVWVHMSLSSVSTLLVVCFSADVAVCWFIYFYYGVWAVFCILFFYNFVGLVCSSWRIWGFCFLLLVTPVSMPLFYKLGVSLALFYYSGYLLLVWAVYSFSEQFFLFKLCGDTVISGVSNTWFN
uniref:NADH dehydrogenase subunit 2 n=1 Tax=Atractolytocestus huronensis TaxID=507542 RepID=A0A343EST2_9CEST|nr:NADH dehydrogenase subunit 2 [Atractolytocestus huronensis]ASL24618.1 NADH dehydrogenase subunit 2 [Atractolytocestus huronensis]